MCFFITGKCEVEDSMADVEELLQLDEMDVDPGLCNSVLWLLL